MVNYFKSYNILFALFNIIIAVVLFVLHPEILNQKKSNLLSIDESFPEKAIEFEKLKRADPKTGKVPSGGRWKAFKELKKKGKIPFKKSNKKNSIDGPWIAVDDFFSSLSISRITFDPNNTQLFYFCTGEGWYNADAAQGAGVWKSTDGGSTWNQLPATDTSLFYHCQDMKVHPANSHIYLATRQAGLQRSKDGGLTWQQVLGTGNGSKSNKAADIEFTKNGNIFAAMGFGYNDAFTAIDPDGIYYSETGDTGTWEKQTTGFPDDDILRIELATAPSNDNVVYAIPHNPTTDLIRGVYKTTSKGITWFEINNPGNDYNFAKKQAWYDLTLAVDPNDENIVVAGGLNLWKSFDGGSTWIKLTHGSYKDTGGFQYVHVDQHEIYFIDSDTVLFGNDGGIWKCDNFSDSVPVFYDRNFSYNVTQFYTSAIDNIYGSPTIIGGTQDNGSHMTTGKNVTPSQKLTGADGAFCAINYVNADILFTAKQEKGMYRFTQGGYNAADTITNPYITNNDALFINPFEIDPNNPELIYMASSKGIWRLNNASTADSSAWTKASRTSGTISAIGISKNIPNILYLGRSTGGTIYRIEGADTTNDDYKPLDCDPSDNLPSDNYTSSIFVNPNDYNHVIVTYSNYGVSSIYESKNASSDSATWKNIEGDLPDIPVTWSLLHPKNKSVCYIGTDIGVFYTKNINDSNTIWVLNNNGLATVRVEMLRLRKSDYTVVAATHGRGLYTGQIDSTESTYEISWQERGPKNVGGRTRTIMQDPNDTSGQTYWAGSVSGGLWKTTNINFKEEDYEPKDDTVITAKIDSMNLLLKSSNPFLNEVTIQYEIPEEKNVSLKIYDISGRLAANLVDNELKSMGVYSTTWSSTGKASGIYFVVLRYDEKEKKVIKLFKQ